MMMTTQPSSLQPNIQHELACTYVSTIGLALSATFQPQYVCTPSFQILYSWRSEKDGDILYVKTSHFVLFVKQVLPYLKHRVAVLVNNDDETFPYDIDPVVMYKVIDHPKILCIFAQNFVDLPSLQVNNFYALPIGLDYHTLAWSKVHDWGQHMSAFDQEQVLKYCQKIMLPLDVVDASVVATNFHLSMMEPPRRKQYRQPIHELLKDVKWMLWLPKMNRQNFWLRLRNLCFVLCPPGNGLDTHRVWEVLCLGRIPIIEDLPINRVYEGLPVWIVKDWKEFMRLNPEQLKAKRTEFVERWSTFDFQRLKLNYWQTFIEDKVRQALKDAEQDKSDSSSLGMSNKV